LFINVLAEKQKQILPGLANAVAGTGLYLAGGTALALQIGHRPSVYFELFGNSIADPEILFRGLRASDLDFTILTNKFETIYLEIEKVQVSFIGYDYPMLNSLCAWGKYAMRLASLDDIACMKLSAVTNRGSRKDFIDLHYLITHYRSIGEYLRLFQEKYKQQDIGHVIKAWYILKMRTRNLKLERSPVLIGND